VTSPYSFGAWSILLLSTFACSSSSGVDGKPGDLKLVWHAVTEANEASFFAGTPAISDGVLYLEDGNTVLAVDAVSGQKKWSRPVRLRPTAPARNLLVKNGRVYVSETDSVLAMDITDGHTIWNFHPDAQAIVYASADDRAFYTGQRDIPFVYALDLADGHLLWKVNIGLGWTFPGHVKGTAVSGDTVYIAARKDLAQNGYISQGVLVALDRNDGHEFWRYETPGTNGGLQDAPVIAGNLVVVSDVIGNGFSRSTVLRTNSLGACRGPTTVPSLRRLSSATKCTSGPPTPTCMQQIFKPVLWTGT
jgi:outer membrane protein assembly factor BamB